jgi:hypothetical protein
VAIVISVVVVVMVVVSLEVRHTYVIATAKAFTIRIPLVARNMRMAVLVAVAHVWPPVIVEVLARTFDPIVKTLPLDLLQFLRWCIPAAAILSIAFVRRSLGKAGSFDRAQSRDAQEKGNCGYYQSIESHDSYLLFSRGCPANQ